MSTEYVIVNGEALELMEDGRFPVYFHFPENTRLFDATSCPPRLVPLEEDGEDKGVTLFRLIPHAPYFAYSVAAPTEHVMARRIVPAGAAMGGMMGLMGMGGMLNINVGGVPMGGIGTPTSILSTPTNATSNDLTSSSHQSEADASEAPVAGSSSSAISSSSAPRSCVDDVYSAIPGNSTVFPALRCDFIDRKMEMLVRQAGNARPTHNPDGTTTYNNMIDRRKPHEVNAFRNAMEQTDQRSLHRYIIVHGLGATTTAQDIGLFFESIHGQYVFEADVCMFEDPASGQQQCRSVAFVEVKDLVNGTFKFLLDRYLAYNGGHMYVVGADRKPIADVPRFEAFPTTVGPAPHREHIEPVRRQHHHNNNNANGERHHHNNNMNGNNHRFNNNSNNFNNNGPDGTPNSNGFNNNFDRRQHNNNTNNAANGEFVPRGGNNGPNGNFNNGNGNFNRGPRNNGPNGFGNNGNYNGNNYNGNNNYPRDNFNNNNNRGEGGMPVRDTRESRAEPLLGASNINSNSTNSLQTPTNSLNSPLPLAGPSASRSPIAAGSTPPLSASSSPSGGGSVVYCVGHINEQVAEASVLDGTFMPSKRAFDGLEQLVKAHAAVYLVVIYDRHPMLFGMARVKGRAGHQLAVEWIAPHRNLIPRDMPRDMLADLSVGEFSTKGWFDGLRIAEGGEGLPTKGNLAACQRLHQYLERECAARPNDGPSTPTNGHPNANGPSGFQQHRYNNNNGNNTYNNNPYANHSNNNNNNNMHSAPVHQGMPRRAMNLTPL